MNNIAVLQALAFEPRKAFAELDARPRYWFPLLVLIVAIATLYCWYAFFVDLAWATDLQLRNSSFGANMTEEELARFASRAASQQGIRATITPVFVAIALPIAMLIGAGYYHMAAKITGVQRSFRHWFSLCCWTSLPYALGVVPGFFVLLTASSNQITQESLQPLSFNELFFHLAPGDKGYALAAGFNLFHLASIWLAMIGIKTWTGRSWLFSFIFATLLLWVVVGVWALFALR